MAAKLFKGQDRRMLLKEKKVLTSLIARECRTQNPKKTLSLSTRTLMFADSTPFGGTPEAATINPASQLALMLASVNLALATLA